MSMFSKNLQKVCSQKAVKQVDLAYRIGVPATTVSGWICGRHEPSIDMLLKVCAFLEVPVGWMVGDPRDPKAGVDPKILEDAECKIKALYMEIEDGNKELVRTEVRLKEMEDKSLELAKRLADVTEQRDKLIAHCKANDLAKTAEQAPKNPIKVVVDSLKGIGITEVSLKF